MSAIIFGVLNEGLKGKNGQNGAALMTNGAEHAQSIRPQSKYSSQYWRGRIGYYKYVVSFVSTLLLVFIHSEGLTLRVETTEHMLATHVFSKRRCKIPAHLAVCSKRNAIDMSCVRPTNDGADDGHVLKMLSDETRSSRTACLGSLCVRETFAGGRQWHASCGQWPRRT